MVLQNYGDIPLEYLQVPNAETTATVIFLHGAGWTGKRQKEYFIELLGEEAYIPHIKFIFPSSPFGSMRHLNKDTTVWFGSTSDGTFTVEDIRNSANYIESLCRDELKKGVFPRRVFLGGISQGGCIALKLAYTSLTEIRAVGVLSTFLINSPDEITAKLLPELYHIHWSKDNLIPIDVVRQGFENLKSKNVKGTLKIYEGVGHNMNKKQLQDMYKFIKTMLPPSL